MDNKKVCLLKEIGRDEETHLLEEFGEIGWDEGMYLLEEVGPDDKVSLLKVVGRSLPPRGDRVGRSDASPLGGQAGRGGAPQIGRAHV